MIRMRIMLLQGRIAAHPNRWEAWVEEYDQIREETVVTSGDTPEEAVGKLVNAQQRTPA